MLDIGAHTGDFYQSFHQAFPDCQCLLMDGNPAVEPHLQQLGVSYHIALLGKHNGPVTFYTHKTNPTCTGNSMFRELSEHYEDCVQQTVQCHRLDDLNKKGVVFDYVKIDAQGAELDIMAGGWNTLSQSQAISLETSLVPYNQGAPLQHEVIKYMTDHQFILQAVLSDNRTPQGVVFQQDLLFVKNVSTG